VSFRDTPTGNRADDRVFRLPPTQACPEGRRVRLHHSETGWPDAPAHPNAGFRVMAVRDGYVFHTKAEMAEEKA
jgi:hypothetical protein